MSGRERKNTSPAGHEYRHVHIDKGAKAQLGDTYHYGLESPLNNLPYAEDAPFNSYAKQHEPTCLKDTRVDLLHEIYEWADGQDERCIFWLNGLAGTGKSTVARTVAREYFEQKRLGASFFFSRGGGDVSHAGKFFTSIVVQLANNVPCLQRYIYDAIKERSDIARQSLRDQWRQLIFRPLSKLDDEASPSSYILVIDALDECDDDSNVQIILQLLAEAWSLKTVRLRVLMTSRPETPIRHGFYQIPQARHHDLILHNLSPVIVDNDISILLVHDLRVIGREHSLGACWPDEQVIRRLVQRACHLFIWAATACRFIREGLFAEERLRMLLEGSTIASTPAMHLNEIYSTVLKTSVRPGYMEQEKQRLYGMLRDVLGSIVILFSPLSAGTLSKLLPITKQNLDYTVKDLHAILDIPKDQTRPLRLHHPSFRDFLLDTDGCGDSTFRVDEKQAHGSLAASCITLMSTSLKQDIYGLGAPGVLVTDIDSSQLERCLALEVQYACLYWVQHLQKGGTQLYDNDEVHKFLQVHLLHWLEALSWMRKISEGILAIISLESIALNSNCIRLYAFIHDIKRFALYSRSLMEQAPLQIYCGAIIFIPAMSIVRKEFKDRIPNWMRRLPNVLKNWSTLQQTLEGHSGEVNAVAFSPDGRRLASASKDRTVRLWDAATGAALQTLEGHSGEVNAVAFSPDGRRLASASDDSTVRLWDAATGAALQTLEGHSGEVNAVAFSPDGRRLASASNDRTVRLWDTATGAALQTLEGHSGGVYAVAFSPDGRRLASASDDRTVRLWDTATGAALQTLEGHSSAVSAVAFSPDGRRLASASNDRTVRLWDTATGAALQTLKGHSSQVSAVAFSPDGRRLASASDDRTVRLWDAATGAALQTLRGYSSGVNAVTFSPDGRRLASASDDSTVRLWDAATGAALQTLVGHSRGVSAVAFSPDGRRLASASDDSTVRLWDAATGAALQTLACHSREVNAVAFSPDGRRLASASDDSTVRLWDTATGAALQTLEGHSSRVYVVAFSPDGRRLASASWDSTIRLWDTATGAALQTLKGHSSAVSAVAFSPDGRRLASASWDRTVRLWDAATGAALQTLEGHSSWVNAVAFSPDGRRLASASDDSTVRLWDAATGAALQTLEGHSSWVNAVAFSPDGRRLASASRDSTVRLWDAATGAALETIEASATIRAISFCTNGSCLETDKGLFYPVALSRGAAPSQPTLPRGISVKEKWVAHGMENLLWLSPEYRPTCVAVREGIVGLGHASGRVSIFELSFEASTTSPPASVVDDIVLYS